jgi:hypothetical protein
MQGYSLSGYLNAVLRRSGKTLLIEGVSDRTIINRLKLEKEEERQTPTKGIVDCVQIITGPEVQGLGNKARIGAVRLAVNALASPTRERVLDKFASLTDREWDDIALNNGLPNTWNPPTQGPGSFTTVGHSIENYFFSVSSTIAYLKQYFPNDLTAAFLQDLSNRFHKMIAVATAYSLELKSANALGRSDGAICNLRVNWTGNRYHLDPSINGVLTSRGLQMPVNFVQEVNSGADFYLAAYQTAEPGRWLCHGHLGEQAIWACIGHLAFEHNMTADIAIAIAKGSRDLKLKHAANHLCEVPATERQPLDDAIAWIQA